MNETRLPAWWVALLPIVCLVLLLFVTIRAFGGDAQGGASQIALLTISALTVLIGMTCYKVKWKSYEQAITSNISSIATAMLILLIIGALSGIWMTSGVVPSLIYYGMHIISPEFFLPTTCIISALVSLMTGSSWTTIATIGIALMGIGRAEGFSEGWIAGAIISGAYFGDKMSPLSDTTVLASSITGTPLFRHIRYMMITTVPTLTLSLIIFTTVGLIDGTCGEAQAETFTTALENRFNITPWLLLVPLFTGILIARRVPAAITLTLASVAAVVAALIAQSDVLQGIGQDGGLFKGAIMSLAFSTHLDTGLPMLDELVATNGMGGMLDTVWLIICAMCFGGTMAATRMLESITLAFSRLVKGRTSMVASTVGSGLVLNATTADQYLSIILTSKMFGNIYERMGYEPRLLSRTAEDAVTVTSVLIPWNTCGMTQAAVLGVATWTYLPYCLFNLLSPLTTIVVAALGFKIYRTDRPATDEEVPATANP